MEVGRFEKSEENFQAKIKKEDELKLVFYRHWSLYQSMLHADFLCCFRPVSRYFDRINRPEQLNPALQRAMNVSPTRPNAARSRWRCARMFKPKPTTGRRACSEKVWASRRIRPDANELAAAIAAIKAAKRPMIIAGGGVLYSKASAELTAFAETHGVPVAVSQAGKSSIDENHPLGARRCRRHRNLGGQCAGRRCGSGARRRDASAGLHDRLLGAVQVRRPQDHCAQRRAL